MVGIRVLRTVGRDGADAEALGILPPGASRFSASAPAAGPRTVAVIERTRARLLRPRFPCKGDLLGCLPLCSAYPVNTKRAKRAAQRKPPKSLTSRCGHSVNSKTVVLRGNDVAKRAAATSGASGRGRSRTGATTGRASRRGARSVRARASGATRTGQAAATAPRRRPWPARRRGPRRGQPTRQQPRQAPRAGAAPAPQAARRPSQPGGTPARWEARGPVPRPGDGERLRHRCARGLRQRRLHQLGEVPDVVRDARDHRGRALASCSAGRSRSSGTYFRAIDALCRFELLGELERAPVQPRVPGSVRPVAPLDRVRRRPVEVGGAEDRALHDEVRPALRGELLARRGACSGAPSSS